MAARFNRHVPALCAVCARPLSVRERRACEWDPEMVCSWHAYEKMRTTFLTEERAAFWISEPSASFKPGGQHAVMFNLPDEEHQTIIIEPWTFFYGNDGET